MASATKVAEDLAEEEVATLAITKEIARLTTAAAAKQMAGAKRPDFRLGRLEEAT